MKREKNSRKIKKLVLCAMFSALGTVMLFLGGLLGDLDLTVSAFASLLVLMTIIEMGIKSGIAVYTVTSVTAVIFLPSYFITPIYILFVGFYPILRYYADRLRKLPAYIIKLTVLNIMMTLLMLIGAFVFKIDISGFGSLTSGPWIIAATYVIANITLIIFDFCLTRLTVLYNMRLRRALGIYKFIS